MVKGFRLLNEKQLHVRAFSFSSLILDIQKLYHPLHGHCRKSCTKFCLLEKDENYLFIIFPGPSICCYVSDIVLFLTSTSRQIEDWSTRNHAEELYMMTHPIEELTKYLNSAVDKLPPSCSSLQGMYLSTLERQQIFEFDRTVNFKTIHLLPSDDINSLQYVTWQLKSSILAFGFLSPQNLFGENNPVSPFTSRC